MWSLLEYAPIKAANSIQMPSINYHSKVFIRESNGTYDYSFKRQHESDIKIRVLSKTELFRSDQKAGEERREYSQCILHIHGGGFIAMSSASHQCYTREWANQLDTPVFSVDYRLAPEHPYPAATQDVYHAYRFLLQCQDVF